MDQGFCFVVTLAGKPVAERGEKSFSTLAITAADRQAIGQKGDEDVRLDARLKLVKDRPDCEVAPLFPGGASGS